MLRRLLGGLGALVVAGAIFGGGFAPAAGAKSSKLCALDTKFTHSSSAAETSIAAAIESGSWSSAQRTLLSAVRQEARNERALVAALPQSASTKVRAAGRTMIGFAATEQRLIRSAQSASQFETGDENAVENPKIESAERTLASYTSAQCGTPVPSGGATP